MRQLAAEAVAALIEVEWSVRRGVVMRAVRASREARAALGEFEREVAHQAARERVAMA